MGGRLKKIFLVAMAALVLRACVVEPVRVTDDSMAPLLTDGDTIIVSKLVYGIRVPGSGAILVDWSAPRKGDLVVAVGVGDPPLNLIRRISAVPGEPYKTREGEEKTLGADEYFLLAEQSEEVMDSRRFGPVSRRSIIGKATHTWFAKNASTGAGSSVESDESGWRILQPIL